MAERDSAFLWETEALRAATQRPFPRAVPTDGAEPEDWLTLRQANQITGVPVPTLRKWALGRNVPSYLEKTAVGELRMVSLKGIYRRAEKLGRHLEARTGQSRPRLVPPPAVDLTETPSEPPRPEVPEGTMLVPLDAWNKILNQLGNLHEAGQQLAEARERAAKAETQAAFLRERLAELREELAQARATSSGEVAETPQVVPDGGQAPSPAMSKASGLTAYSMDMSRRLAARWRRRRG